MTPQRIVIIGGGFAGVECAKRLRSRLSPAQCDIVLFDRENHMVFHPLLPEVAGGSINPDAVGASLRQMLRSVRCRTEAVTNIDLAGRAVEYHTHEGHINQLPFDHVVIACGRSVNLGIVPGMADHAFPLKTVGDAMTLRAHVLQQLEKADVCDDMERRRWYLSFVIVGGGFSGVEAAGEINDLVRGSRRFFSRFTEDEISVTLIHAGDQILPEISPSLRAFAATKMTRAGVTLLLDATVQSATPDGVSLKDGRNVPGGTVVCTIGTTPSPLVERLDVAKHAGRLLTRPDMRLRDLPHAWALGDCASVVNAEDGRESPPTGQFAVRQGRQAAQNIVRVLRGQPTRPFRFRALGQFCAIGGERAVAELFGFRMSGVLAWLLWRSVYLLKLPTWSARFKAATAWASTFIFARDLLHVQSDQTSRISHAYYRPGDYIFHEGDPATSFYVIEKGEVEVLSPGLDTQVSILGPGDFFGEMALVADRPRRASVRARTAVELVIMGSRVFTQISQSLTPLQRAVSETIARRQTSLWLRMPEAHDVLRHESLRAVMDPPPPVHLSPESTFGEAVRLFAEQSVESGYVLDDHQRLVGIVTRTDLNHTVDALADVPRAEQPAFPVRGFMTADPIVVAVDDSPAVAAMVLRDHRLKRIPVVAGRDDRRLVGYLRAEKLMAVVMKKLAAGVQ
jgi:NADH dehydrogenase